MTNFTPFDTGPIYAETRLASNIWLVEPWNTLSNLIFLGIVLYWTWWCLMKRPGWPFLRAGLPFLFLGWLGGSFYHAWRSLEIYYIMDYLPIYVLAAATSLWFWSRLGWFWMGLTGLVLGLIPVVWQLVTWSSSTILISVGYAGMAAAIFIPVILCERRSGWKNFGWLITTLQLFVIALCFRHFDLEFSVWFPRGTHFLWHIFGALAVHCLLIILTNEAARDGQTEDSLQALAGRRLENG